MWNPEVVDPLRDEEPYDIVEVAADHDRFDQVITLAASVLNQDRYLRQGPGDVEECRIVAALDSHRCVGFLRFSIQEIGRDVGRPPVVHDGKPLREGFVQAFGVAPSARRRGIGTGLQTFAADYCRRSGCYQMRSRSPITSTENYVLKIVAGYTLHPSEENDSYYFTRRL